jgi:hypothetical protein
MPGTSPGMTAVGLSCLRLVTAAPCPYQGTHQNFFTLFVDAIFTTLLQPLFTNILEVLDARSAEGCMCRVRHAD